MQRNGMVEDKRKKKTGKANQLVEGGVGSIL